MTRAGFDRMVAEVCLGKVGAVAAREVSRFAPNSLDLYRFRAGQLSHYATLASNASGLMPPRYEWRRRVL